MPGTPAKSMTVTGYSLASAIDHAEANDGFANSDFTLAEVNVGSSEAGEAGASTVLSGDVAVVTAAQATEPAGSSGAPVFWIDSQGAHFADASPSDYLTVTGTAGAFVTLFDGTQLIVQASVPRTVRTGQSVTLTASSQPAGSSVEYQWLEDGGSIGFGASLKQTFYSPGDYDITVVATTANGSVGAAHASLQVGSAPKGPSRSGGGTVKKKSAPTRGPGTKGSPTVHRAASKAAKEAATPTAATHVTSTSIGTTNGGIDATTVASTRRSTDRGKEIVPDQHQHRQRLVSGVALGMSLDAPASTSTRALVPGVADPARTGHIMFARSFSIPIDSWLTLGAMVSLALGAGLQLRPRVAG